MPDPPDERHGSGPLSCAVWENDGKAEAYALYRFNGEWAPAGPQGTVEVGELVASNGRAEREIWRFIFGIDLVRNIKSRYAGLPIDSPLPLMLAEPRRLQVRLSDALWVRVVDVKEALARRSYRGEGRVTLAVSDPLCDWNDGAWAVEVSGDSVTVERTSEEPEITLGASSLGSVYLGGMSFRQLSVAGLVTGAPEALSRADDMFRSETAPWCPEIF